MKNLFFLLCLLFVQTLTAQDKVLLLENLFNKLHEKNDFNGNVLIAEKGKPIFIKSYGVENDSTQKKLTQKSIFNLASISKQFVTATIVLLEKEGKLSYDDKLSKFFPELSFYKDITIDNLIHHTSGLPDYTYTMEKYWDKSKIATNKDVIKMLAEYKPKTLFTPNEKFKYNNTGYILLASIIENVSGKKLNDILKEKIFNPLQMDDTFIYQRRLYPKKIENMTIGYSYSDSLQRKITPDEFGKEFFITYLDGIYGPGHIFSTTEDLLKWDRSLYTNKILSNKDKERMFSNYKTKDGKEINYGYGWFLGSSKDYGKYIQHGGRWGGYLNYFERHIDNDKTIIILQNVETDKTRVPSQKVRMILYDKIISLPTETLKKYEGKYKTKSGKIEEILFIENKLFSPLPMDKSIKLELLPASKTEFTLDEFSPTVTYQFLTDKSGNAIGLKIKQEDRVVEATKIE